MTTKQKHADDFEGRLQELLDWYRANARYITLGAIAVVAVVATVWFARANARNKELSAGRALAEAQQAAQTGNLALAQSDLQRLLQRYGGTRAAIQARLQLAQVLYDQAQPDSGVAILRAGGVPSEPFVADYYALLAVGLEMAGKPAEAAAEYLRAADAADTKVRAATLRADAARAFEEAGDTARAREIWASMAADETNPIAGEAKVRLGELTAKAISG